VCRAALVCSPAQALWSLGGYSIKGSLGGSLLLSRLVRSSHGLALTHVAAYKKVTAAGRIDSSGSKFENLNIDVYR
jgi:hypothetical protein